MKDPVTLAKRIYETEPCARSFEEDFILHWNNPYAIVHKDAHNLGFAYPVNKDDPYEVITNPQHISSAPNCWWIYLLVGDFRALAHNLNPHYDFVGWERNNEPRFYKLAQLLRCI